MHISTVSVKLVILYLTRCMHLSEKWNWIICWLQQYNRIK